MAEGEGEPGDFAEWRLHYALTGHDLRSSRDMGGFFRREDVTNTTVLDVDRIYDLDLDESPDAVFRMWGVEVDLTSPDDILPNLEVRVRDLKLDGTAHAINSTANGDFKYTLHCSATDVTDSPWSRVANGGIHRAAGYVHGARVLAAAVVPAPDGRPNFFIGGSTGGLWQIDESGKAIEHSSDWNASEVRFVAVHPRNPLLVVVGCAGSGLFRSVIEGPRIIGFTSVSPPALSRTQTLHDGCFLLTDDPFIPDLFALATEAGLFTTRIESLFVTPTVWTQAMLRSGTTTSPLSSNCYSVASTGTSVVVGLTSTSATPLMHGTLGPSGTLTLSNGTIPSLAVAPERVSVGATSSASIYYAFAMGPNATYNSVLGTTDGGANWAMLPMAPAASAGSSVPPLDYIAGNASNGGDEKRIAVDRDRTDRFMLPGWRPTVSTDSGATFFAPFHSNWRRVANDFVYDGLEGHHGDVQAGLFLGSDLLVCCDGGALIVRDFSDNDRRIDSVLNIEAARLEVYNRSHAVGTWDPQRGGAAAGLNTFQGQIDGTTGFVNEYNCFVTIGTQDNGTAVAELGSSKARWLDVDTGFSGSDGNHAVATRLGLLSVTQVASSPNPSVDVATMVGSPLAIEPKGPTTCRYLLDAGQPPSPATWSVGDFRGWGADNYPLMAAVPEPGDDGPVALAAWVFDPAPTVTVLNNASAGMTATVPSKWLYGFFDDPDDAAAPQWRPYSELPATKVGVRVTAIGTYFGGETVLGFADGSIFVQRRGVSGWARVGDTIPNWEICRIAYGRTHWYAIARNPNRASGSDRLYSITIEEAPGVKPRLREVSTPASGAIVGVAADKITGESVMIATPRNIFVQDRSFTGWRQARSGLPKSVGLGDLVHTRLEGHGYYVVGTYGQSCWVAWDRAVIATAKEF